MIPRHPEATRTATLFPDSTLFRSVMCTADPQSSQFHAEVAAMAKRVSDHVIPKTRAYHEIWYGGERVASSELEEPFYGRTYMPRKFKIGFALPPSNDIDEIGRSTRLNSSH